MKTGSKPWRVSLRTVLGRPQRVARAWIAFAALEAAACASAPEHGRLENDAEAPGTSPGGVGIANPAAPPAGSGAIESCTTPGTVSVSRTPLRRISRSEYNNSVRDLFGDASAPARDGTFPNDERVGSFVSNSVTLPTPVNNEQLLTAAETVARRAVANVSAVTGCAAIQEAACLEGFLSRAARQAFRGAHDRAADASLLALYRTALDKLGHGLGLQTAIEGILLDPRFLYVLEFGVPAGRVSKLTGLEVAGRLAAFLWRSVPTPQLLEAAENGQLDTREGVQLMALQMLVDPKARAMAEDFGSQWLQIEQLEQVFAADPELTPQFRKAMRAHTLDTFRTEFEQGTLRTLLTASTVPPGELAAFYGSAERPGVLTHGSVMATNTGVVKRGRLVRQNVMCDAIPDPPKDVQARAGEQVRDECQGCHRLMDPVGIAFEHYDSIGRSASSPVNARGQFNRGTASTLEGTFDGPVQMMQMLADDRSIHQCFATQVTRYALNRSEQAEDACSLSEVSKSFIEQKLSLKSLILAVIASDAFLYRNEVDSGKACR